MANNAPTPQPGILDISPTCRAKARSGRPEADQALLQRDAAGASPKAIAAYKAEAEHLERYPDGGATALRNAIAGHYGLNPIASSAAAARTS